ncbi:hypothetical protein, partial [Plesiomonas shigelloides]
VVALRFTSRRQAEKFTFFAALSQALFHAYFSEELSFTSARNSIACRLNEGRIIGANSSEASDNYTFQIVRSNFKQTS